MSLVSLALAFVQYTYLNTYGFDRNADSIIVSAKFLASGIFKPKPRGESLMQRQRHG